MLYCERQVKSEVLKKGKRGNEDPEPGNKA